MKSFVAALFLIGFTARLYAPPPLVTGDVPTAEKGRFELYAGVRYQESETGKPARQIPFTELVYGITDRQELTFENPLLEQGPPARLR